MIRKIYIIKYILSIIKDDRFALIRAADEAIARSDVLHAKTGELVYCVAKGLAFETFGINPSLAAQEVNLREYVRNKTRTGDGLSALEIGEIDAMAEVAKIFLQYRNGKLLSRMEAGLAVPANGAEYAAILIKQKLATLRREREKK